MKHKVTITMEVDGETCTVANLHLKAQNDALEIIEQHYPQVDSVDNTGEKIKWFIADHTFELDD